MSKNGKSQLGSSLKRQDTFTTTDGSDSVNGGRMAENHSHHHKGHHHAYEEVALNQTGRGRDSNTGGRSDHHPQLVSHEGAHHDVDSTPAHMRQRSFSDLAITGAVAASAPGHNMPRKQEVHLFTLAMFCIVSDCSSIKVVEASSQASRTFRPATSVVLMAQLSKWKDRTWKIPLKADNERQARTDPPANV